MNPILIALLAAVALTGPGQARGHHPAAASLTLTAPIDTDAPVAVPALPPVAPPIMEEPPPVVAPPVVVETLIEPKKSFLERLWDWLNR